MLLQQCWQITKPHICCRHVGKSARLQAGLQACSRINCRLICQMCNSAAGVLMVVMQQRWHISHCQILHDMVYSVNSMSCKTFTALTCISPGMASTQSTAVVSRACQLQSKHEDACTSPQSGVAMDSQSQHTLCQTGLMRCLPSTSSQCQCSFIPLKTG